MYEMSKETFSFVTKEVSTVHSVCDRAMIPREVEGELLSMAQRVHVLERCYREMVMRLGKDYPEECH